MKFNDMREIKFRGYSSAMERWYYGSLVCEPSYSMDTCAVRDIIEEDGSRHPVGKVGQFTGLHDKNGKEIYEGDIICSYDSQNNPIKHEVYYLENEARFATKLIGYEFVEAGSITQKWIDEFDKVVVGNIFDNPELLEKG